MDLPNDSERDSYKDNEQRLLPPQKNTAGVAEVEHHYLYNLLLAAYIRFRHGYIGQADVAVVAEMEQTLNRFYQTNFAALSNDELYDYLAEISGL